MFLTKNTTMDKNCGHQLNEHSELTIFVQAISCTHDQRDGYDTLFSLQERIRCETDCTRKTIFQNAIHFQNNFIVN